jgi:hypothetical protein
VFIAGARCTSLVIGFRLDVEILDGCRDAHCAIKSHGDGPATRYRCAASVQGSTPCPLSTVIQLAAAEYALQPAEHSAAGALSVGVEG